MVSIACLNGIVKIHVSHFCLDFLVVFLVLVSARCLHLVKVVI